VKTAFYISLAVLLSSCSFNKLFLQPDRFPATMNRIKMIDYDHKDTMLITFNGSNFQPTFLKKTDTLKFDFTVESVVFTSSNGHKLNGWFLKPKNSTPTTTLLHFHGNAGSVLSQYRALSPLLKNNFQIFVFDYSGFGFSEGKATRKNVLTDAFSALDYVKSRTDVTNTKLVIYGQSLGGHLSPVVAAQREKDIDALVIEGAFSSHKDIAATFAHKVIWAGCIGRLFTKCGYSAKKSIQKYHKPVLIVHSTEDEVIPFKMGKKLFEKANQPKEFYEIKKCHICGPTFYPDEISERINKMLK
jgi:fermentation-respiration switch protein FrsA (DUF1100 family)